MVDDNDINLRDYFAAKAMQAMITASASLNGVDDDEYSFSYATVCGVNSGIDLRGDDENGNTFQYTWAQYYAEESYEIANAMMEARKRIK